MAAKGQAARRANWERHRSIGETLVALSAKVSALAPALSPPQPVPEPMESYAAGKLNRVREQLRRLDDLLDTETDPQKLDRLASAIARLSEIERQFSNRPMPGSLRPVPPQRSIRPAAGRVVELMPPPEPQATIVDPHCGVDATISGVPAETPQSEMPQGNNPQ